MRPKGAWALVGFEGAGLAHWGWGGVKVSRDKEGGWSVCAPLPRLARTDLTGPETHGHIPSGFLGTPVPWAPGLGLGLSTEPCQVARPLAQSQAPAGVWSPSQPCPSTPAVPRFLAGPSLPAHSVPTQADRPQPGPAETPRIMRLRCAADELLGGLPGGGGLGAVPELRAGGQHPRGPARTTPPAAAGHPATSPEGSREGPGCCREKPDQEPISASLSRWAGQLPQGVLRGIKALLPSPGHHQERPP